MAYVPNNKDVFVAAYSGALSGMRASERKNLSADPATYANSAVVAGAWAQSFDTAWGAGVPNSLDVELIFLSSYGVWADGSDLPASGAFVVPATWNVLCEALIALVDAGEAYFSGQAITPPAWNTGGGGGGGGGGTTTTANFVQPAVGSDVVVSVASVVGGIVGSSVLVGGGGGAYSLKAVGVGSLTLTNLGTSGGVTNAVPTTVIASGSTVTYDGAATRLLSTGDVTFTVAGNGYDVTAFVQSLSGAGGADTPITVNSAVLQIATGVVAPVWGQAAAAGPPTQPWTLRPQGTLVIDLQVPPGGGAIPFIDGRYEGNHAFMFGMPFGSDAFSGLWLFSPNLAASPTGDNVFARMNVGGTMMINSPFGNGLTVQQADSVADNTCPCSFQPSGFQLFSFSPQFGSGNGVLSFRKATTNPTVDMPAGYLGLYYDGTANELKIWSINGLERFVLQAPLSINGTPTTSIFVDPQNSTTTASDNNPGTALLPLLTTAYLVGQFPGKTLSGDTTITYLSDDTSGDALVWDALDFDGHNLSFVFTTVSLHAGGTLNAGTVTIDPTAATGGQPQLIHTTDVADFTPFVVTAMGGAATNPTRLVIVGGGDAGHGAWLADVRSAGGPAVVTATQPTNATSTAPGALTIGDTYKISRGGLIRLGSMGGVRNSATGGGTVTLTDAAFTADSVGQANMNCTRCGFAGPVQVDCFLSDSFAGAFVTQFLTGEGRPNVSFDAGAWASGSDLAGDIIVQGNTYIGGAGPSISSLGVRSFAVLAGSALGTGAPNSGVQVNNCTGARGALDVGTGGALNLGASGSGLLWGKGNTGTGIAVEVNSDATVIAANAALDTKVTGTAGDFQFGLPSGGALAAAAFAFDPTTGAYITPTRATTWANLQATIVGGGFNGHAHRPDSNASVVGV